MPVPEYYESENIVNLRDLGGIPCRGGFTAKGMAFRCGMPRQPTEKDCALLKSLGIRTIIDLRGIKEAAVMPSAFLGRDDFDYYHFSLLEANPSLNSTEFPLWNLYSLSLKDYGKNYANVLRLIGNLDEPFLFHCFLGKDRTGVLSAALLSASGASRNDIIENYSVSFDRLQKFLEREIAARTGLIWEQDISRLKSERKTMEKFLEFVDGKYGGFDGYFRHIGLSDQEINNIGKTMTGRK